MSSAREAREEPRRVVAVGSERRVGKTIRDPPGGTIGDAVSPDPNNGIPDQSRTAPGP